MRRPRSREPRIRNYAAEYARRISRALAMGLTRGQARGHPPAGETYTKRGRRAPDPKLEQALRGLRETNSLNRAAKAAGVSPERFLLRLEGNGCRR